MSPSNDPIIPILLKSNTLDQTFDLSNEILSVKGVPLLTQVPSNVSFSSFASICTSSSAPVPLQQRVQSMAYRGGFLGFESQEPSSEHLNSIGKFKERNFLSIFRFKTWWSTQWVGDSGSDLQMETQWVLFDVPEIESYVIVVPLIEGGFRSALQAREDDNVMIFVESGSTQVKESFFKTIAYVHVSNNPYNIMKEAFSAIRVHLDTFKLLEEKSTPSLIDKFGWCTWDAFYLMVDPIGIWHGVGEFVKGGISPRFLIIDDGWQSIETDEPDHDLKKLVTGGEQMTSRLYRLDEGEKFRSYKGGSFLEADLHSYNPNIPKMIILKANEVKIAKKELEIAKEAGANDLSILEEMIAGLKKELDDLIDEGSSSLIQSNGECACDEDHEFGMKAFTRDLRTEFKGLDDIFVWHALCGAWGGVRPNATHLKAKIAPCFPSKGLDGTMNDLAVVKLIEAGIGLVDPDEADEFYDSMHSHLASSGITGVKVDVIHTLEYVSEEYGGRVELAKKYYEALSKSLKKNFNGTNLISSMQQCNDFFFLGTKQISMGRAGDDFWYKDPNGDPDGVFWLQGVHTVHCSYNSLWMGQIIHPDWDMFKSDHICAKFHAASRAICGGPIYVSDSLGEHDFDLLKKLVYFDGSIPKCTKFALPTRDCLFKNPLFDEKTILKIWNFNKYGGILGAFNTQGAGWDPKERRIKGYKQCYKPLEAIVHVNDIEWDQNLDALEMGYADEYAVYTSESNSLVAMNPKSSPIHIVINPSTFELFTFVPIKELDNGVSFAPIGIITMFNSGGTIHDLEYNNHDYSVGMKIKGQGKFLAYSNKWPKKCLVNGEEVDFEWFDGFRLELDVDSIDEDGGVSNVVVYF